VVFAFLVLLAAVVVSDLGKRDIADAPVVALYVTIAASIVILALHFPPFFNRFSHKGKQIAYVVLIGYVILFVYFSSTMQDAYARSPAGIEEAAEQAKAARQAEAARIAEAERTKAERQTAIQREASEKQADLDAQKPAMCKALVGQVVDGTKTIEINNVSVETSFEPNEKLTCSGDAFTASGNVRIQFGLVQTPQGKMLVSVRYP